VSGSVQKLLSQRGTDRERRKEREGGREQMTDRQLRRSGLACGHFDLRALSKWWILGKRARYTDLPFRGGGGGGGGRLFEERGRRCLVAFRPCVGDFDNRQINPAPPLPGGCVDAAHGHAMPQASP
jgi:hypothetical protein